MISRVALFATHVAAAMVGGYIGWIGGSLDGSDWFYESREFEFPRKVLTRKAAPDGRNAAKVLYDQQSKNYFLAVEGPEGAQLVLTERFVPSAGYHDPIVTLSWADAETVRLTVDHDFGDGNLVYEFDVAHLLFKKTDPDGATPKD